MAWSDLDPTDGGGNWATGAAAGAGTGAMVGGPVGALVGGAIGLGAGVLNDLTGGSARRRRKKLEEEARRRQAYYDQLAADYRGVPSDPYTQTRAENIFEPMGREIDRAGVRAAGGVARGMSRRNIGGAYSMGAQGTVINQAGEERARARAAALDRAIAEGQQSIAGAANISQAGDPFAMQMLQGANAAEADARARSAAFTDNSLETLLGMGGRYYSGNLLREINGLEGTGGAGVNFMDRPLTLEDMLQQGWLPEASMRQTRTG